MPANLVSIIVLRINLTRRKYCRLISASRFDMVSRFVLSPLSKDNTTSLNIPSAIELILFRMFCGLTDVSSSKNWTEMFVASSSTISMPTSFLIEARTLSLSATEIGDLPLILIISYPKR